MTLGNQTQQWHLVQPAMQLTAVLTPAEEGGFVASNPATGTTSRGGTAEEATANLRDATCLYLIEPMDAVTREVVGHVRAWAASEPRLQQLWLYGSRATGRAKPTSDIDFAFRLTPLATEDEQREFRDAVQPRWQHELQAICPWEVHLEPWAGGGTIVADAVAREGIEVYRATTLATCTGIVGTDDLASTTGRPND